MQFHPDLAGPVSCTDESEVTLMELYVATFGDLMKGQPYAEIIDLLSGDVVRKLSVAAGKVQIDAFWPPIIRVDLQTPITYESRLDRGDLTFSCAEFPGGTAKICTNLDVIRFSDGTEYSINFMQNNESGR